ncbi:MAG TPA: hypothetical protein VM266_03630 [Solirubrobacteraceae bacterium]|nr:hypothetical protein [Solirubrobacteraceae bacterium]
MLDPLQTFVRAAPRARRRPVGEVAGEAARFTAAGGRGDQMERGAPPPRRKGAPAPVQLPFAGGPLVWLAVAGFALLMIGGGGRILLRQTRPT